jgi:hypothetical protein
MIKRRTFLRGLGGASVALPVLGAIAGRAGAAPLPGGPRNAVFFWTPNGPNMSTFFPRARYNGGSTAFGPLDDAAFAPRPLMPGSSAPEIFHHPEWALRNLSAFRDRMLVLRGFRNSRFGFVDLADGGDHGMNTACRLTAAGIGSGRGLALGRSVDFAIAEAINPRDGGVARDPLVLHIGENVSPDGGNGTSFVSYRGPEMPEPGVNNPWVAYRNLMGIAPGTPAEDHLTRRRGRVADLVRGELGELQRLPLGARDRGRLDSWLGLLESTEDGMRDMGLMCTPEARDALVPLDQVRAFEGRDNGALGLYEDYARIGTLMLDITALSIACGHTHVGTIQWSGGAGGPAFGPTGMGSAPGDPPGTWHGGERHHELSHRNGSDGAEPGLIVDVERNMSWIDGWYGDRFRHLLESMDALGVLDDSVVVWATEFSDGRQHHFIDLPFVLAGGAGGYFRGGATVDCSSTGNWDSRLDPRTNGPRILPADDPANVYDLDAGWVDGAISHNKLLTTVYNAVLPRDTAGRPMGAITRFPMTDTADTHNVLEDGEIEEIKAL